MRQLLLLAPVALLVAPAVYAGSAAASVGVTTNGNVWTNSVLLPSGSSVRAGDIIRTDSTGMAVIANPALGRIEIRNDSSVTYGDQLVLHSGSVGSAKTPVRLGDLEIVPKDGSTDNWFVVAERDGRQMVAAHRGDVLIRRAGTVALLVPAGSFATPDAKKKKETGEEDDDDDDKAAAATVGGAAAGGAAGASGGGAAGGAAAGGAAAGGAAAGGAAATTGWVIAGVAAAVGGTVAGVTLTGDSSSPSQ